jgi:predicted TIM-barrel fold metal-dependent hydrolase
MPGSPNRPAIIDAHTHIFPDEIVARRDDYVSRDPWFRHLYEDPRVVLASPADLLASMDVAGIQSSIVSGFPWADPGLCRAHTEWMAAVCQEFPERLGFLGIVVPHAARAAYEAEHALQMGALGLGEFNADAQGFDLCRPDDLRDVLAVCARAGKPIMLHASEPVGHAYFGKGTATPDRLVAFLTAFPAQSVVLAHWGGGLPFYELMPEVRAVTHYVTYDSAATTYLYNSAVFPAVVSLVGPERVLFASDYPVLRQDRLLRRVRRVLPDQQQLDMVLGTNAARVYGLAESPTFDDEGEQHASP